MKAPAVSADTPMPADPSRLAVASGRPGGLRNRTLGDILELYVHGANGQATATKKRQLVAAALVLLRLDSN